jgi:heat shock protein HslJ
MRRIIYITVAFAGVLVVGAIVTMIIFAASSTPPAALTQPTWTLTQLVVDGQEQALSPTHSATLHFGAHDGQVSGSGGCNTFGASYSLHGNQVQFGALRSTLIGCLDPVVAGQESHYFQALPRVQTYQIVGTTLTLRGDSDRVQLTFRAS